MEGREEGERREEGEDWASVSPTHCKLTFLELVVLVLAYLPLRLL
jgi:hypothetical protein